MDAMDRLLIERACERLITQYCHFVDHGEAARIADLFAEDGVWASSEHTATGRDAVRAWFQGRQDNVGRISRHVCDNALVQVVDQNHAEAVVYLTLYRHDGDAGRRVAPSQLPKVIGEYRDRFVLTPDGWRFQRRDVAASFVARAGD